MNAESAMKKTAAVPLAIVLMIGSTFADAENLNQTTSSERPATATVTVDFTVDCGKIKPMNAVNNGPVGVDGSPLGTTHGNFHAYKAARIPFARTHDASEYIVYGGDHCVDISAVFPNFDADETRPESYDFAVTDAYLGAIRAAGTEPFYRLGQRIEHAVKKYHVYPPKDFAKWARICEHVIRHYNFGWANGFKWNIKYWEIWNEADVDWNRKGAPRTWGGTAEEFFEFYSVAAKHLKKTFPDLKIGGPAAAGIDKWCDLFLKYQQEHQTPMDFFSWHIYARNPDSMAYKAKAFRDMMAKYGYGDKESILNEWNFVKGWREDYHHSIVQLASQKGAALVASGMIACQNAPVDMLMYYDAKPDAHFNGLFDKTTLQPLKPYYALYSWGRLSGLGRAAKADSDTKDIYVAAARDAAGRRAIFIARYSNDNNYSAPRPVTVRLSKGVFPKEVRTHVTDDSRMHTEVPAYPSSVNELQLRMDPQSFTLVEFNEPPLPPKDAFTLATFNIRIDTDGKGNLMDKGDNAWTNRRPRVASVIQNGKFDLIGFQEVTRSMWKDVVEDLPEYEFADGKDKFGPNPIVYRPQLFERLKSGRFSLSEKPNDWTHLSWGSSSVRVCQWALFKVKSNGRILRMFNMHPDWKSRAARTEGMRQLLLPKIKKAKADGELVILTGDMNDMVGAVVPWSPYDPKYAMGDSVLLAKSVLHDSFDAVETVHQGPIFSSHGYQPPATRRIDCIFLSDEFRVMTYRTHDDRPGGKFPSDHDAVSVKVCIR